MHFYLHICFMNERVSKLYVAIVNNEVVCFETNLKRFAMLMVKIEPSSRNYDWFFRSFKKDAKFQLTVNDKVYYFQQLV